MRNSHCSEVHRAHPNVNDERFARPFKSTGTVRGADGVSDVLLEFTLTVYERRGC